MYVVAVEMSYDEAVKKSEELDDTHRKIEFKYPKPIRDRMNYIREKYRREAYSHTVRYLSLHVTNDEGLERIKEIVKTADRAMKDINKELYATMVWLEVPSIEKGKQYEQLYYAICLQMAEEVYKQVKKLKSSIPTQRTRNTIEKLLRRFKTLNVIGDKRINEKIEELEKIVNQSTDKIKEQIMNDIEKLREELQDMMVV